MQQAKMMMKFEPSQSANVYKLYIYDDVVDEKFDWSAWDWVESETSAEYFRKQLEEIPANASIELFINSNGGSVKEGVSIYNQLKRHQADKTAYIDGVAYSVAFLIAMAADKVVMGLGTSAMVHEMWACVQGNAAQLRREADVLDKLMETNRQIFLEKCGDKLTEDQLVQMMAEETFLTPEECLEYGFIDEISENVHTASNQTIIENNMQMMQQYAQKRGIFVQQLKELDELHPPKNVQGSTQQSAGVAFFNQFLHNQEEEKK